MSERCGTTWETKTGKGRKDHMCLVLVDENGKHIDKIKVHICQCGAEKKGSGRQ